MVKARTIKVKSIKNKGILMIATIITTKTVIITITIIMIIKTCNRIKLNRIKL